MGTQRQNTASHITTKMPMTPTMRKANEKNAKNVTKRGQVKGTSKSDDKYPVSPELIALFVFVVIGSAVFHILQLSAEEALYLGMRRIRNPQLPKIRFLETEKSESTNFPESSPLTSPYFCIPTTTPNLC